MVDKAINPPPERKRQILRAIQLHEHDVLTAGEVHESLDEEVSERTIKRNLYWMEKNSELESRQIGGVNAWWIAPENIPAEESIVAARGVQNLLADLYHERWEFKLMAAGAFAFIGALSALFWGVVVLTADVGILSDRTVLTVLLATFVFAFVLVFVGLFLFPIETLGDWTSVPDSGERNGG